MDNKLKLIKFNEITSTHTYVLDDAEGEDVLVVANTQTQGVSSKPTEKWHSDEGGLFMSLRVTNRGLMANKKKVAVTIGNELSSLFSELFNLSIQYKAPNDFYVKNKKIGGVLIVTNNLTTIYSLGLNINQLSFKEEIKDTATSVAIETTQHYNMDKLIGEIQAYFEEKLNEYTKKIPHYIKPELTRAYKRLSRRYG